MRVRKNFVICLIVVDYFFAFILVSGGEINTERMAKVLVDEFRSGKLGRFTLEEPEEMGHGG